MANGGGTRQRARRTRRGEARRILVVTEGQRTEPQYVERLNAYLRSSGATTHVKPVGIGKDPLTVVRRCVELRDRAARNDKDYDVCVCLVDVDSHAALDDACTLARRESILLLISNLKFEAWLRWHIEDRRSALASPQLDDLMAKLGLLEGKDLSVRFPIEGVRAACDTARKADSELGSCRKGPDPSSAMPVLVDHLLGRYGRTG